MTKFDFLFLLWRRYTSAFLTLVYLCCLFLLSMEGYTHLSQTYLLSTIQTPDITVPLGIVFMAIFGVYLLSLSIHVLFDRKESIGSTVLFWGKKIYSFFFLIGSIGVIDLWSTNQLNVPLIRSCLLLSVFCFLYRRWNRRQDQQLIEEYQLYQGKEDLQGLQLETITKEVVIHQDGHFPPRFPDRSFESTRLVYQIPYSLFRFKIYYSGVSFEEDGKELGVCFLNMGCSVLFGGFAFYGLLIEQRLLGYSAIIFMSVALFCSERQRFISLCKKLWILLKQWWKTMLNKRGG